MKRLNKSIGITQEEFDFEYRIGLVDDFEYNLDFKIDKI